MQTWLTRLIEKALDFSRSYMTTSICFIPNPIIIQSHNIFFTLSHSPYSARITDKVVYRSTEFVVVMPALVGQWHGMDSVCEECTDAKRKYDSCFNNWFSDRYLRGKNDLDQCDTLYKDYQNCLKTYIEEKGVDLGDISQTYLGTTADKLGDQMK
ncbi:hypothetical protein RvY_05934 [Ramazzottius varieornatus]|uniref:Uncharacterized protein n=1 Tax=Ramazzottius varieornatus TaxID=947166 RepID=A0A1D1V2B0_RAMVA|nr:hypothetical protein RvY_05934 [Ramazzottius varieornatus]